ncbi:MAG: HAMP domain-containing protein [Deltaproteobacteria bacterium]|nr:HAMP domain-containing protein [Deltaproteobacteria bacterium]MBW2362800.1 HAMP domain-containing protein [Deltaproteobacteria bacterium]
MARRRGLQTEVLVSLAVVMLTATAVLGALVVQMQASQAAVLERLAARALLEDASRPLPLTTAATPELRWWTLREGEAPRPHGAHGDRIDPQSRALAEEARRRGRALLQPTRPWQPLRFAVPLQGEVRVAWLPPVASGAWFLALLAADVVVFTAFGAALLRQRLVRPLERLDAAARAIAEGDFAARVPADGPHEIFEVATAFNGMTEALDARTRALEKAVGDLRESNQELREAREGLDRAERLAAVGHLAAGVAHEVGNPMGAVLAFLDLARRDPGLSTGSRGYLERAAAEGARVRQILRQLLDFSRPPRTQRAPVDLPELVKETAGLVRAQRRYAGIAIEVETLGCPPAALADRNQLSQILLNLLLNAADAVEATSEPLIQVRIRGSIRATREDADGAAVAARRDADAVECRVADNGPGVPEADRARIFDPFFSTKEAGQGTGLGLSNALRFAEELGGNLTLDTEPDRGAVFVLTLPAVAGRGSDEVRAYPRLSRGSRSP